MTPSKGLQAAPRRPAEAPAPVLAGAVKEHLLLRGRQIPEGGIDVEAAPVGNGVEHVVVIDRGALGPRLYRPFPERKVRVRDDEVRIEFEEPSQAVAGGAGALGAVEGEAVGRDVGIADVVDDAGQLLAVEKVLLLVHKVDEDDALGLPEGRLDAFCKPPLHAGLDHEPVDHDLDVVLLLLVHRDRLGEVLDHAVDPGPHVPRRARGHQLLLILALPAAHDRRQHLDALVSRGRAMTASVICWTVWAAISRPHL